MVRSTVTLRARKTCRLRVPCIIVCCAIAVAGIVRAQTAERERMALPHFETAAERLSEANTTSIVLAPPTSSPPISAPPHPVRAAAEFELQDGTLVRWAYGNFDPLLGHIVDAARKEGAVWILVRPGTQDSTNILSFLAALSIPSSGLTFLPVSSNSIWCRDYGPWTVYDSVDGSRAFVEFRYNRPARPLDDAVPSFLASRWGAPLYQTQSMPDSLVFTGGNFMVDGFGTGFASGLVRIENPRLTTARIDSIMLRYCGVSRFIVLDTLRYDAIHHIDMHMKLLDEETILVGQFPVNTSDYAVIERTAESLKALRDCYGRPYRILRIPMPPDAGGRYPPNSDYNTYTNALIINRSVLVPVYGFAGDAQALDIYRDAMPGYNVVGFDCSQIIPAYGAIHCITKDIGARDFVRIAHAPLRDTHDATHDYRIDARIDAAAAGVTARVYWSTNAGGPFTETVLFDSAGIVTGRIPHQPFGTRVYYYLTARSGSGASVSKPMSAPGGTYAFSVIDSTVTSLPERRAPITMSLGQNYPNPVAVSGRTGGITLIPFTLAYPAEATVTVANMLGESVGVLFSGALDAGDYTARWDAHGLPAGAYMITLSVRSRTTTRVMTRLAMVAH
jgi:agmatine deiminase